jgi:hypothetical protein
MAKRCQCGHYIESYLEDLGCLECGTSCCPACSYSPEDVVHCASCAEEIFNVRTLFRVSQRKTVVSAVKVYA